MRNAVVVLAAAGAALVVGSSGAVAQVPTRDSVVGSGQALGLVFEIDVSSGASGEAPTGQVRASQTNGSPFLGGPPTCLAVSDNVAILNVRDAGPFGFGIVTLRITDAAPNDELRMTVGRRPEDCSPLAGGIIFIDAVFPGDFVVTDAPPLPTSTAQCKNGGWRNFAGFKNQGDCVSFVATGGKNRPSG